MTPSRRRDKFVELRRGGTRRKSAERAGAGREVAKSSIARRRSRTTTTAQKWPLFFSKLSLSLSLSVTHLALGQRARSGRAAAELDRLGGGEEGGGEEEEEGEGGAEGREKARHD